MVELMDFQRCAGWKRATGKEQRTPSLACFRLSDLCTCRTPRAESLHISILNNIYILNTGCVSGGGGEEGRRASATEATSDNDGDRTCRQVEAWYWDWVEKTR